ncbi:hypothetical protein [Streptomyces sp. CoH17]|uniref:hypothetical protein n=1 Tax=Streptomyces sp. CoH17 TaxID=2992806 RepID=UPI00226EC696|nr:hypothetical protein [Streptomyces sp. CoH17]
MKKLDSTTWTTVSDGGKYQIHKFEDDGGTFFAVLDMTDPNEEAEAVFESEKYRPCVKYIEKQQGIDSAFRDMILEVQGEAKVQMYKVLEAGSRRKQATEAPATVRDLVRQ